MQEQRHRLAIGTGKLRSEPVELLGLAGKARIHDKRIEADETPAGGIEAPAILAENGTIRLQVLLGDGLRRRGADLRRIVTDVVIAGQITAGNRKRVMQRFGEFEIVAIGRTVEGEIAGIDDEIGALGIDGFADPIENCRSMSAGGGPDGCRKSGSDEIRACNLPSGAMIYSVGSRNDEIERLQRRMRLHRCSARHRVSPRARPGSRDCQGQST